MYRHKHARGAGVNSAGQAVSTGVAVDDNLVPQIGISTAVLGGKTDVTDVDVGDAAHERVGDSYQQRVTVGLATVVGHHQGY